MQPFAFIFRCIYKSTSYFNLPKKNIGLFKIRHHLRFLIIDGATHTLKEFYVYRAYCIAIAYVYPQKIAQNLKKTFGYSDKILNKLVKSMLGNSLFVLLTL